jgi:hypothetical protein
MPPTSRPITVTNDMKVYFFPGAEIMPNARDLKDECNDDIHMFSFVKFYRENLKYRQEC